MSEPVLVRGQIPVWLTVCRILAAVLAVAGIGVLLFGEAALGTVLSAIGGGLWIALEVSAAIIRAQREWLEDTGDGFLYTSKIGEEQLQDEQVTAIAFEYKKLFVNGTAKSMQRICRLWIGEDEKPIEMINKFLLTAADPLFELLTRLNQKVRDSLDATLREGGDVEGDGWWMNRDEVHVGSGRTEQVVPTADITECAIFDNQMCLWQVGQDLAFVKFPAGSRNACLLPSLLAESVQKHQSEADSADSPGLGRILFERKAKTSTRVILILVAMITGLVSLAMIFGAPDVVIKVFGGFMVILTAVLLYSARAMKRSVFRCHQRGVHKVSVFSDRQMRYTDVESFTYSATRHYHNGAYVGTYINMKFDPLPEIETKVLTYNTSINGEDEALEELRDFISRAIAARMADRLSAGQRVKWTDNLTFQPEGIEFRKGGFVGRKPPELLPLTEYHGYGLDQGTFSLFRKDQKKPVMTESASAKNFFPGFYLLQLLLHVPGTPSPESQEPVEELEEVLDELPEA